MASLSLTANLEPNRYCYPTSPAPLGNGVVISFLIKAPRFSERPGIVLPEVVYASTRFQGLISPSACFRQAILASEAERFKCFSALHQRPGNDQEFCSQFDLHLQLDAAPPVVVVLLSLSSGSTSSSSKPQTSGQKHSA